MDLTKKERLIISNQLRILEALYPEEAEILLQHRTALERGYALHYDWLVTGISDEMSHEDCTEILDILGMFRALNDCFRDLEDKDKVGIDEQQIRFGGFDGNNEAEQLSYVRYFIFDLGRFDELREHVVNSHMRMLPRYQSMLSVYQEQKSPYPLSKELMIKILGAGR